MQTMGRWWAEEQLVKDTKILRPSRCIPSKHADVTSNTLQKEVCLQSSTLGKGSFFKPGRDTITWLLRWLWKHCAEAKCIGQSLCVVQAGENNTPIQRAYSLLPISEAEMKWHEWGNQWTKPNQNLVKKSCRVKGLVVVCYHNVKRLHKTSWRVWWRCCGRKASDIHAVCRMNPLTTLTNCWQHKPAPDPR